MAQNLRVGGQISPGNESEGPEAKVGEAKHHRAAQGEQDEADLNQIEERQHEQVEANVARVDGIGRPEILGPNQAQQSIPLASEGKAEHGGHRRRPKNEKWGELARMELRHPCRWPALGRAGGGMRATQQVVKVGKLGQNQEIDQHIGEHGNKGDGEHGHLGETEPPENDPVAERTEPQQFRSPVDEIEKDNKKDDPKQRQTHGGEEQATPRPR